MLFISRRVFPDKFGVYDTDDCTENIVDEEFLMHCCLDVGIDVKGFSVGDSNDCQEPGIAPYQPTKTLSREQVKLRTITGVDIKVFRGSVVSIWWNDESVDSPIRIRLSDYAKRISDCIFVRKTNIGFHKVTLVLDDKIDVGKASFSSMSSDDIYQGKDGIGVALDVREVTDRKRLDNIYRSFFRGTWNDVSSSIIDFEERKKDITRTVRLCCM